MPYDTLPNGNVDRRNVASTLQSYPDSTFGTTRVPNQNDTLHLLSELLGKKMTMNGIADLKGSLPTIPINDLRGEEASLYSRAECVLRRSLAALYRLVDIRGWTHSIYNHISARSPDNPQHFLINPFGLLYHEIQASTLVKIDEEGTVIQQGTTVLGVNKAGWTLHAALHAARSDVNCIVHVHLPDVIAVSCIRAGLLPVSPEANELLMSHGVRYHDYCGILVEAGEQASIQSDLGETAKILFLRNHGVAIAAASVAEAWYLTRRVVSACQTQMRMLQLAGGASLLKDLKDAASQLTDAADSKPPRPFADLDDGREEGVTPEPVENGTPLLNGKAHSESKDESWSPVDLEFEAEMRVLDSAGFRTGHVYRQPNLLRHAHAHVESMWAGDTFCDQATGAELLTTDFSANEFSTVDDVTAAEAAGAQQVARIADSVKVNRSKGTQRNQWLSEKHNGPGLKPRSADRLNKSATLPANANRSLATPHMTNTLPIDDAGALSADEEKPKNVKKAKKIGSFRMPSFSKKKKPQQMRD